MPYCAVSNCSNKSSSDNIKNGGISYHVFPQYQSIRKLWILATGKKNWSPNKYNTICSVHFQANDFKIKDAGRKRKLHKWAYPTIEVWSSPKSSIMEEAKKPTYKYCVVPECKNTSKNTPDKVFFNIPRDAKARQRWCKIIRKEKVSPTSSLYCCEDHFDIKEDTANYVQYSIMKQQGTKCTLRLKKGVVPHIFLCRKRRMRPPVERMGVVKRQRLALVNDALLEYARKTGNVLDKPPQRSKKLDGLVNFISDGYGGRGTDVMIVQDSNYLQCLPPNKAVVADRGHKDMSCLVVAKKCTLIKPPVSKTTPSSKDEAKQLNQIVALRIQHVEKLQDCQNAEKSADEPEPRLVQEVPEIEECDTASNSVDKSAAEQVQEIPEIEECDTASNFVDKSAAEQVQEIPEGKMIIARVYHYFKNEYEILKAFTGNHWEMNPLANYLQRTAEATGVSAEAVTMIVEDKKYSVESEHVAVQKKDDEKEPEVDSNYEGRSSPLTFDMSAGGIKIKVEHIDEKEPQLDCAKDSEELKPVRRRATSSSVRSKPSDEEQLPFPSPIQLRVHGVMKTEYKTEPSDDECSPTLGDDPLKTGDSVDHENVATITKIKEESDDDTEMLNMEQSINIMICDALQTSVATVHVKDEPSSPAD